MKDKVYISFYNKQDNAYKKLKSNLTLLIIHEIINYLDGIEDKCWCIADTEIQHLYKMIADTEIQPLFKSEVLLGVYLNENDAILFKLKFGL